MDRLADLPIELLLEIFTLLTYEDLTVLQLVPGGAKLLRWVADSIRNIYGRHKPWLWLQGTPVTRAILAKVPGRPLITNEPCDPFPVIKSRLGLAVAQGDLKMARSLLESGACLLLDLHEVRPLADHRPLLAIAMGLGLFSKKEARRIVYSYFDSYGYPTIYFTRQLARRPGVRLMVPVRSIDTIKWCGAVGLIRELDASSLAAVLKYLLYDLCECTRGGKHHARCVEMAFRFLYVPKSTRVLVDNSPDGSWNICHTEVELLRINFTVELFAGVTPGKREYNCSCPQCSYR